MQAGALTPYETALRYSATPLRLVARDGTLIDLDVSRWLGDTDPADESVIERCTGPVLDVGCGPGRFVEGLQARGVPALGVDIAETAVSLTRGQGGAALVRSVFADLPGEGRWPTALLMDGNVGIDGDPVRLLTRIRTLLAPGGCLVVETDANPDACELLDVRFCHGTDPAGPEFAWAQVGLRALRRYALETSFRVEETWLCDGREFAVLRAVTTG